MVDFLSVFKKTGAYKTLVGEKKADRLSHAYLLVSPDGDNLIEYLKICAKLILCKEDEVCGSCRTCKLIDSNTLTDIKTYPSNGESVVVSDVADLIIKIFFSASIGLIKLSSIKSATSETTTLSPFDG